MPPPSRQAARRRARAVRGARSRAPSGLGEGVLQQVAERIESLVGPVLPEQHASHRDPLEVAWVAHVVLGRPVLPRPTRRRLHVALRQPEPRLPRPYEAPPWCEPAGLLNEGVSPLSISLGHQHAGQVDVAVDQYLRLATPPAVLYTLLQDPSCLVQISALVEQLTHPRVDDAGDGRHSLWSALGQPLSVQQQLFRLP